MKSHFQMRTYTSQAMFLNLCAIDHMSVTFLQPTLSFDEIFR